MFVGQTFVVFFLCFVLNILLKPAKRVDFTSNQKLLDFGSLRSNRVQGPYPGTTQDTYLKLSIVVIIVACLVAR